jgi:hypothetical protein
MKNNIFKILLIVMTISSVYSQEIKKLHYFIITCEINGNYSDEYNSKKYYWIIPEDSIKDCDDFKRYPLYIDGFSRNHRLSCIKKKDINIFSLSTADDFDFSKQEIINLDILKEIINNKSTKFFSLVKNWKGKGEQKVKFSVTPVSGSFCYSQIDEDSGKQISYSGLIYIPLSDFRYEKKLINSKLYNYITRSDFGNFDVRNR